MEPWATAGLVGLVVGAVVEIAVRRRVHGPEADPGTRGAGVRPAPRDPRFSPWLPCLTAVSWVATVLTDVPPVAGGTVGTLLRLTVVTLLVAAARVDVAVRRLPDALTLPAAAVCLLTALPALLGDPDAGRTLLAAVALPTALLAVTLTAGGIGLGDVKAGAPVGALLGLHGWDVLVSGSVIAWAGAAAVGLALLTRGARRDTPIPLGPFLVIGALTAPLLS